MAIFGYMHVRDERALRGLYRYFINQNHVNHLDEIVTPYSGTFQGNLEDFIYQTKAARSIRNKLQSSNHQFQTLAHIGLIRTPSNSNLDPKEIEIVHKLMSRVYWQGRPVLHNEHFRVDGSLDLNYLVPAFGGFGGLLDYRSHHQNPTHRGTILITKLFTSLNHVRQAKGLPLIPQKPDQLNLKDSIFNNSQYSNNQLALAYNRLEGNTLLRAQIFLRVKSKKLASEDFHPVMRNRLLLLMQLDLDFYLTFLDLLLELEAEKLRRSRQTTKNSIRNYHESC